MCRVLLKQGGVLGTNVHVFLLLPRCFHFISQMPLPFFLVIKPSLSKETIKFQWKTEERAFVPSLTSLIKRKSLIKKKKKPHF